MAYIDPTIPLDEEDFDRLRKVAVKEARLSTGILAFSYILGGVLSLVSMGGYGDSLLIGVVLTIQFGLAAVMMGLAFWAKRSPTTAMVAAAAIYGVIELISIALEPSSICKGLLVKVVVIGALYRGLRAVHQLRQATAPARF